MTTFGSRLGTVRRRAVAAVLSCVSVAIVGGLIGIGPIGQVTAQAAPAGCAHDHHVYAATKSAKRVGSSVAIKARLGKRTCGLDEGTFTFSKGVKTLTVPKSADVEVLKVYLSAHDARVPVKKLPRYINRGLAHGGQGLFQITGSRQSIRKFVQIFLS